MEKCENYIYLQTKNLIDQYKYIIEYLVMIKMECLVRAGIENLYKIISVGYTSNKEMEGSIDRIDK